MENEGGRGFAERNPASGALYERGVMITSHDDGITRSIRCKKLYVLTPRDY